MTCKIALVIFLVPGISLIKTVQTGKIGFAFVTWAPVYAFQSNQY